VASVTYLIDFAAAGGHAGIGSASIKVGQSLAVTEGRLSMTKDYSSTFSNGAPSVAIGQPIESGQTYGTIIDDTSDANKVAQEAANVFSAMLGGGTSRSRTYTIQADPDKYKAQSIDLLKQANTTLIEQAK
jgi:hypothetical protein